MEKISVLLKYKQGYGTFPAIMKSPISLSQPQNPKKNQGNKESRTTTSNSIRKLSKNSERLS